MDLVFDVFFRGLCSGEHDNDAVLDSSSARQPQENHVLPYQLDLTRDTSLKLSCYLSTSGSYASQERELFIMFVYDTKKCQKEEDDPQDAVVFFHPSWVTDQQRMALCGQLMGATQFFISAFSCPSILSLNSGKFVVQQLGQYIITVGTDQNLPDWILKHRAKVMLQLLQFYHKDFETIQSSVDSEGEKFTEKLKRIFEVYVPIVQHSGNIFGNIPTIRLPKSASSIFLEAIQVLQSCQEKKGVLNGTVLYQNKIVATQLSSAATKTLISTDPYRIRSPAEHIETPFHLPIGVQLLKVFIDSKEYRNMLKESAAIGNSVENISVKRNLQKKAYGGKVQIAKEQISSMKRDTSRIFTVPEEREEMEASESSNLSDVEQRIVSLNNDTPDKNSFNGVTTPMKDSSVGKLLHEKVMSICRGSNKTDMKRPENSFLKKNDHVMKGKMPLNSRSNNNLLSICNDIAARSVSLNDLNTKSKVSRNSVPLRCYSFGLPRITRKLIQDEDCSPDEKLAPGKRFFNTITDPLFPVFRWDGVPISHSLYDEYVSDHYQLLTAEETEENSHDLGQQNCIPPNHSEEENANSEKAVATSRDEHIRVKTVSVNQTADGSGGGMPLSKQEMYRRSLSLPLKSLNMKDETDGARHRSGSYCEGDINSPILPKRVGSLQLTPLMSKLSILADEERGDNTCEKDQTESEPKSSVQTNETKSSTDVQENKNRVSKIRKVDTCKKSEKCEQEDAHLESACLYVFGQQNMSLALVLDSDAAQDPEVIHSLWQTSVSGLAHLEGRLRQCLEYFPNVDATDQYSFLCLDSGWDVLHRGGRWGPYELDIVSSLHENFTQSPNLTEIVVRREDRTVYGYHCGSMEVFYQQDAGDAAGLPTPSDLMGVVPLKARRRLERDHGIVLL